MKRNFVVFLIEQNKYKVVELNTDYHPLNLHINQFLKKVVFNGKEELVFELDDEMYRPTNISKPFMVKSDYYQIVDVSSMFGHYYVEEVSNDGGKTFNHISFSKCYIEIEECYNDMKRDAMESLINDIDYNNVKESSVVKERNIIFSHYYILITWGEYQKRFRNITMA